MPANDGLWEVALATRDDLVGRLAITPLALEVRGLDVIPQLIDKVKSVGDEARAEIARIIMVDEVGHVATGKRRFDFVCGCKRSDPIRSWQGLVRQYFKGDLNHPLMLERGQLLSFQPPFMALLLQVAPNFSLWLKHVLNLPGQPGWLR